MSVISTHNSGFFSCCNIKLNNIVDFINNNNKLPESVDSSQQFSWYKPYNSRSDITYEYFKRYNLISNDDIIYNIPINYNNGHQFYDYSKLDYKNVSPIVKKYFSPSDTIKNIIRHIENKYDLVNNYNNICVLFYRGNDKNTETLICGYDKYIDIANKLLRENPEIKFLIQSDETEFIETFKSAYPNNSFYFKDEIRHMKKCMSTVDKVMKSQNYLYSKYYLAITIIMSKCKYIVCGSGNCSLWIMLYRGNANNTFQYLNNELLIN